VDTDLERVKREAISNLHAALASGTDFQDALRLCCYRNPLFTSTLLTESVRERFGPDSDIRSITGFVSRIIPQDLSGKSNFPRREAEAVIRASLGETELLDEVDPSQLSYPEIGIAVLGRLFLERHRSEGDITELFTRVEGVLALAKEMSSELEQVEDNWFAIGMHDSPFAFPLPRDLLKAQKEEKGGKYEAAVTSRRTDGSTY
jgi:hypothetical protein